MRITINGREYSRLDDVPPELRSMLAQTTKRPGLTIHVTSTTLLALLAAMVISLLVAWLMFRR